MNDTYLNEYLNYLKNQKRYSNNTILSYKRDLSLFFSYAKKEQIQQIDYLMIQSYISNLYVNNISTKTISRKLSSLKSYCSYLNKYKNINTNYIEKIDIPKIKKKIPEYLHQEELEKLMKLPLNTTLEIRNALIVNFLYSSGLRLSELTNLKLNDFNYNEFCIKIKGKGAKERIIVFSKKTKELLDLYLTYRTDSETPYLLLNKNKRKLSNRGVELILKKISLKYLGHNKLHPHMLRHTFATKLLNSGMDIRTLQELLGHDSINATQIYTHIAKNELSELYTSFHPRSDNRNV